MVFLAHKGPVCAVFHAFQASNRLIQNKNLFWHWYCNAYDKI